MQDTLGNILGGLALQLDNSIEIGDWVKIDDVSPGRRHSLALHRHPHPQRRNRGHPNSQLMKGKVWVIGDRDSDATLWRRFIHFNVGYVAQPAGSSPPSAGGGEAEIANVARSRRPIAS